ncbi:hypothetical protein KS4_13720 [Poriferisphaera corsica]|uniref:Uncharacterized protein n=1 Tax=Poriferisphaera corsica TaxID=2528020 RepID=A0A517YSW6_9BACT|nr:hypothetical protein KS4_13720 [Poriferisphaera corsica]
MLAMIACLEYLRKMLYEKLAVHFLGLAKLTMN